MALEAPGGTTRVVLVALGSEQATGTIIEGWGTDAGDGGRRRAIAGTTEAREWPLQMWSRRGRTAVGGQT